MTDRTPCLDENDLQELVESPSSNQGARSLEHLNGCPNCRERLRSHIERSTGMEKTKRYLLDWSEKAANWTPKIGELIHNRYRIEREIDRGGQGVLVQATDIEKGVTVALKFLRVAVAVPNMLAEAGIARQIRHSDYVVPVLDVIEDYEYPCLVLEYVPGRSLRNHLANRDVDLSVQTIILWAMELANGLRDIHGAGIVHRDLKPENILVKSKNNATHLQITDMGLARPFVDAGRDEMLGGSIGYMAPEIVDGILHGMVVGSPQSDLFSLGCILFELCTGRQPFKARTFDEYKVVVNQSWEHTDWQRFQANDTEVVKHIPDILKRLISDLIAKEPSQRPRDAAAVCQQLDELLVRRVSVPDIVTPRYWWILEPLFGWSRRPGRQPVRVVFETGDSGNVTWQVDYEGTILDSDEHGLYDFSRAGRYEIQLRSEDVRDVFLPSFRLPVSIHKETISLPKWLWGTILAAIVLIALTGYAGVLATMPPRGTIDSFEPLGADQILFRGSVGRLGSKNDLYLVAESGDKLWPHESTFSISPDGHWSTTLNHKPLFGSEMLFSLWVVSPAGQQKIRQWMLDGKAQGNHYVGIEHQLDGGSRLASLGIVLQRTEGTIDACTRTGDLLLVNGTVKNLPRDNVLHLAIQTTDGYWPKQPKDPPSVQLHNGVWEATVEHKPDNRDSNVEIRLGLWSVSPAGHKSIVRWFDNGQKTGHYPPLPEIPDATRLAELRLTDEK